MSFRNPDERVPESEPWRNCEFLRWAYHERGLSPQTFTYELGDTEPTPEQAEA